MAGNESHPQFGAKAQNLINLAETLKDLKLDAKIPQIHPISHNDIIKLFRIAGLDLEAMWMTLIEQIKKQDGNADDAIVAAAANGLILELQHKIRVCSESDIFKKHLAGIRHNGQELSAFLVDNLMCRSSSNEDKADSTNPGGNQSFPAEPRIDDVAAKIGMVLASYFSAKSLAQRRSAKEDLSELPLCSVLLQHMVSEPPQDPSSSDKPSTVSGVAFTSEADADTRGFTLINCTFGHGEGVVQGTVPSDTYLISDNGEVDRILVEKTTRIAPDTSSHDLVMVANPSAVTNLACLTSAQILKLNHICRRLEKHYGNPLDIEWVFKDNQFYIVQVRPLSKPLRPEIEPNYIAENKQHLPSSKLETIVSANNVRQIDAADEIIIMQDLPQALRYYLSRKPHNVKAIIVRSGVATSHEANYFRWLGIPVFASDDWQQVRESVNDGKSHVICSQTANIYQGKEIDFRIDAGLYAHPYLQAGHSLYLASKSRSEIEKYVEKVGHRSISSRHPQPFKKIRELIHKLRIAGDVESLAEINELFIEVCYVAHKQLYDGNGNPYDRSLVHELEIIIKNFSSIYMRLDKILSDQNLKTKDPKLYQQKKLIAINALQNIIKQPRYGQAIHSYSLWAILNDLAWIKKITKKLAAQLEELPLDLREILLPVLRITKHCLSPQQNELLTKTLLQLASENKELFINFCQAISYYEKFNILHLVINLMDLKRANSPQIRTAIIQSECRRFHSLASSPVFKEISIATELDRFWRQREAEWGTDVDFEKRISQFKVFVDSYKRRLELLRQSLLVNDKILQQVLINSLNESINTYDAALKALSGSNKYKSTQTQCADFLTLLKDYWTISSDLILMLHDLDISKGSVDIRLITERVEKLFERVEKITDKGDRELERLMQPSFDFDVSTATFTNMSIARTSRSLESLADVFTLAHQNSLEAFSVLQSRIINVDDILPKEIKSIIDSCVFVNSWSLTAWLKPSKQPKLTSWTLKDNCVTLNYNYPLREHSANISISYSLSDPSHVKIDLDLIMSNENARCIKTRSASRLLRPQLSNNAIQLQGYSPILDLGSSISSAPFFSNKFTWSIDTQHATPYDMRLLAGNLRLLLEITTDHKKPLDKYPAYEPLMFKDSFAGIYQALDMLLKQKNNEMLLQALIEIFNELVLKKMSGLHAEADLCGGDTFILLCECIERLLKTSDPDIPDKTFEFLTTFLSKQVNFSELSGLSVSYLQRSRSGYGAEEKRGSFIDCLYDRLKLMPGDWAEKLVLKIDALKLPDQRPAFGSRHIGLQDPFT